MVFEGVPELLPSGAGAGPSREARGAHLEPALWRSPATASCPDTSVKISRSASPRLATQAAQGAMVLDTEDNGEGRKKGRREDATT